MILTWIFIVIFSTVWTYYLALERGREASGWIIISLFIGIFAPLFLLIIPHLGQRKCVACAEMVKIEAKLCKYCRSDLPLYSNAVLELDSRSKTDGDSGGW